MESMSQTLQYTVTSDARVQVMTTTKLSTSYKL